MQQVSFLELPIWSFEKALTIFALLNPETKKKLGHRVSRQLILAMEKFQLKLFLVDHEWLGMHYWHLLGMPLSAGNNGIITKSIYILNRIELYSFIGCYVMGWFFLIKRTLVTSPHRNTLTLKMSTLGLIIGEICSCSMPYFDGQIKGGSL